MRINPLSNFSLSMCVAVLALATNGCGKGQIGKDCPDFNGEWISEGSTKSHNYKQTGCESIVATGPGPAGVAQTVTYNTAEATETKGGQKVARRAEFEKDEIRLFEKTAYPSGNGTIKFVLKKTGDDYVQTISGEGLAATMIPTPFSLKAKRVK